MVSRKYAGDYRLENTLGPGGKIVTVTVYHGTYYAFESGPRTLRRARAILLAAWAVYWAFFWLGLSLSSGAMRLLYVSLPYFCGFLPAAYFTSSVYYLFRYSLNPPEKGFTREQRDRIYDRVAQCSIIMLLLSAITAAALVIYYLSGAGGFAGARDIAVVISAAAMVLTSCAAFATKKHVKMRPS